MTERKFVVALDSHPVTLNDKNVFTYDELVELFTPIKHICDYAVSGPFNTGAELVEHLIEYSANVDTSSVEDVFGLSIEPEQASLHIIVLKF